MNKIVIAIMLSTISLMGCAPTTYTSSKVGPDRYVHASHGKDIGAENYAHLLKDAYNTCTQEGFQDYKVTGVSQEKESVVVFSECQKEKAAQSSFSPLEEAKKLYESAKKKVESFTEK